MLEESNTPLRSIQMHGLIVCDDIRFEIGGKLTLVGVLGPVLEARKFPTRLRISILGIFAIERKGEFEVGIQVKGDQEHVHVERKFRFDMLISGRNFPIPLGIFNLKVDEPGKITFRITDVDGDELHSSVLEIKNREEKALTRSSAKSRALKT